MRVLLAVLWWCLVHGCNTSDTSACDTLWASQALNWSSFYSWANGQQHPNSTLGPPNVYPEFIDASGAWCPESPNSGPEFLLLQFNQSIFVAGIEIYETWYPGALTAISLVLDNGVLIRVWSDEPTFMNYSRAFAPRLTCMQWTNTIRLDMDTHLYPWGAYYEIDAVAIKGTLENVAGENLCLDVCSLSCMNGGVCVVVGMAPACDCPSDLGGPLCEFAAQYPVEILDHSSDVWGNRVGSILGPPDGYGWSFDLLSFPGPQFAEFAFETALYPRIVTIYGTAAPGVTSVAFLTPNNTWLQVWAGVASSNDTTLEFNVGCSVQFMTKTMRLVLDNPSSDVSIDSVRFLGHDVVDSLPPCEDYCLSFLNNNNSCQVGRCQSLFSLPTAQCVCPQDTLGEFCGLFYQFASKTFAQTLGGVRLSYTTDRRDGIGGYYYINDGVVTMSFEFQIPVYFSSYDFIFLDNTTGPALVKILARSDNSSILYDILWDKSKNGNWTKPLCQPMEPISVLRLDFFLPLCNPDCTELYIDAIMLLGSTDRETARNGTLPSCPSACMSVNPCQNSQPCVSTLDNTTTCECSLALGGEFCEGPLNYVVGVIESSWFPNQNPVVKIGISGAPDIYPGASSTWYSGDCWSQGGCNHSWSFPLAQQSDIIQFLDLRFARYTTPVAIALYETAGFGVLTKVLLYHADHWVEVWASKNGSDWLTEYPVLGRESFPAWVCEPTFATDRVRLEFNTSLDGDTWNEWDAFRLFNISEAISLGSKVTVPTVNCMEIGCTPTFCTSPRAGTCVTGPSGPYCVCARDFSGDFCEFEEYWPISSFSTSDRYGTVAGLVGEPDVYPLTNGFSRTSIWAPTFDKNIVTVDYNLTSSLYMHAIELFNTAWLSSDMALVSVAIGSDAVLQEVWNGNISLGSAYRTLVSVSNFSCIAPITRIQLTLLADTPTSTGVSLDTIGVLTSPVAPSPPACTFGACAPNPCENGGKCFLSSSGDSPKCSCVNGYFGPTCSEFGHWWASAVKDVSAPSLALSLEQTSHSLASIVGLPDVATYGNDAGGFRFEARDDQGILRYEYIEVTFPTPVYLSPMGVLVVESRNPGCITRLLVRENNGTTVVGEEDKTPLIEIWAQKNMSGDISQPVGSLFEFRPTLHCLPAYPIQSLRIEVNTAMSPGWEEYDAISLIGSIVKPSPSPSSPPICESMCLPSSCLRGVCTTRGGGKVYCNCPPLWTGLRCDRPSPLQMRMFLRNQLAVFSGNTLTDVCHITLTGEVNCYGSMTRVYLPPSGRRFIQVTVSSLYVCALDNESRAECWTKSDGKSDFVAPVPLSSIAGGGSSLCGIRESDAKIQCFFCNTYPTACNMNFHTKFTQLTMSELPFSCGLSYTGQPVCFPPSGLDPTILRWSNDEPPRMPPIIQLDIGNNAQTHLNRCYLFVNGSVACQRRYGFYAPYYQLANSPKAPWGLVVVGENNDVCGLYANTGIVSCQDNSSSLLNTAPFSGQAGFLALQANHMRVLVSAGAGRVICAVGSDGTITCASTPSLPPRFGTLPASASVTLPCDYLNGGCGEFSQCTNTVSGVECRCLPGFRTVYQEDSEYFDCVDIDECALRMLVCPPFRLCQNLPGSAECSEYHPPVLHHIVGCDSVLVGDQYHPENCTTSGTQTITICGMNIIDNSLVVIGRGAGECSNVSFLAPNSTVVVSNNVSVSCPQAFTCQIPEGHGVRIDLSLLSGGQAIDTGLFYSYTRPLLESLAGCTEECARMGLPRPTLELFGQNFGLTPVVLVGAAICPLLTNNHSFIKCALPEGRGIQPVVLVAGGQLSNFLTVSYASCLAGETDPTDQRNLSCVKCAKGFAKDAIGSSPCTLCAAGKYASNMLEPGSTKCLDCVQAGLTCSNGLPASTEQFWGFEAQQSYAVVHCPPNHCLANNVCESGRLQDPSNVLCAQCEPGLLNWGNSCVECTGFHWGLFIFMILLCEFFCVFSHLMKRGSQKAGVTRLLVYFVQIALVMAGSSKLHVSFLSVVNFDLATASTAISNSCVFPIRPEDQLVVSLLQPLIFLGVLLFNFGFRHVTWNFFLSICKGHKNFKTWQKRPKVDGYFRSGLALLLFAYSSTCTKVFNFLRCQEVAAAGMAPVNVMFYYPTINCEGEFYTHFRPLVIFVLVFYVLGFPIMSLGLLSYWKRKNLLEAHKNGRWGVLYELYHTRVFYWQSIELLLRFVFALIDSEFSSNYLVRASLFSFVNLTALLAQIVSHPYTNAQVNKLESVVHAILLCLAFLLSTDATGNVPEGASWVFFTFVLLVLILLGSVLTYHKTHALYQFYTHRTHLKGERALHGSSATEMTTKPLDAHPEAINAQP